MQNKKPDYESLVKDIIDRARELEGERLQLYVRAIDSASKAVACVATAKLTPSAHSASLEKGAVGHTREARKFARSLNPSKSGG